MNTLVIAAHDGHTLDASTAGVVTAARQLASRNGAQVQVLVVGHQVAGIAAQAAALGSVDSVLLLDDAGLAAANAETLALQLAALAPRFAWMLSAHTMAARAALPRAAALCGGAYLSDVVSVGADSLVRPAHAGAVLTTVRPRADTVLLTVRASSFAAAAPAAPPAPVARQAPAAFDPRTRVLHKEGSTGSRPDLSRARIVVGGGRGVGSAHSMGRVEALADHLGAAVGASRAAVDAGFASNAVQIGQTGKTIAPDVYVALGISGAIQHLAGIKDAKCIVAVNKDADAPIFQIADYGLVGDLFDVLPVLQQGLPAASDPAA